MVMVMGKSVEKINATGKVNTPGKNLVIQRKKNNGKSDLNVKGEPRMEVRVVEKVRATVLVMDKLELQVRK